MPRTFFKIAGTVFCLTGAVAYAIIGVTVSETIDVSTFAGFWLSALMLFFVWLIWRKKEKRPTFHLKEVKPTKPKKVEGKPFYIRSNITPAREDFDILNEEEQIFFTHFKNALVSAKLKPADFTLTRLSGGTFNVDCHWGYIGKIALSSPDAFYTYAVWKNGCKRASRIFSDEAEALAYKDEKNADYIENRQSVEHSCYMQYMVGLYNVKELELVSLQQCIDTIPRWIAYIKYCKRS